MSTTYPLEHWDGQTGRILVRRGPRTTAITKAYLHELIGKAERNATGTVRPAGIVLDEADLAQLRADHCDCAKCDDASHAESMRREADLVHRMGEEARR